MPGIPNSQEFPGQNSIRRPRSRTTRTIGHNLTMSLKRRWQEQQVLQEHWDMLMQMAQQGHLSPLLLPLLPLPPAVPAVPAVPDAQAAMPPPLTLVYPHLHHFRHLHLSDRVMDQLMDGLDAARQHCRTLVHHRVTVAKKWNDCSRTVAILGATAFGFGKLVLPFLHRVVEGRALHATSKELQVATAKNLWWAFEVHRSHVCKKMVRLTTLT